MPELSLAWFVDIAIWAVPLVIAITFHEAAHGFVAFKLGDRTAYDQGRVTFNPFKHIDRFGTIILPLLLFLAKSPVMLGYAKPVPISAYRLRNPKTDMIWVALAGPGINLLLALIAAGLFHLLSLVPIAEQGTAAMFLNTLLASLIWAIIINCVLMLFNLLPILPLDGGRVIAGLLPAPLDRQFAKTERVGMIVVFLLLLVPALLVEYGVIDTNPILYAIGNSVEWVLDRLVVQPLRSSI